MISKGLVESRHNESSVQRKHMHDPIELVTLGFAWFAWLSWLAPLMWRLHVRLPQVRRVLESEPDSPHKQRDLRRIDLQLDHVAARRSLTVAFVAATLALLGLTVLFILVPG